MDELQEGQGAPEEESKELRKIEGYEKKLKDLEDQAARKKEREERRKREQELKQAYKAASKGNHSHRRTLKIALAALIVGIVVGGGAVLWIQGNKPAEPDQVEQPSSVSVVFSGVMKQNELVTASQKYQIVEKVRDANTFFDLIEIPFTENSYWYRYVSTIKVAVDLSTAELVGQDGNTITISLDNPFISSNTPDMDESGVLEENDNFLNPIHVSEVDEYRKLCMEKAENEAANGDLFEEARSNAVSNLSELFSAALDGEYSVDIQWRDA